MAPRIDTPPSKPGNYIPAEAPVDDPVITLLQDIRLILELAHGRDVRADVFEHQVFPLAANTAGQFDIESYRPFEYILIPNVPRALTWIGVGQALSHRLTDVSAGQTVNIRIPRGNNVAIVYAAGTGTVDILDVYLSTRPIHVDKYGGALGSVSITGSVALADATLVALEHTFVTIEGYPAAATVASVADTAVSTTLLASNASRKGASIYNNSPSILYVKYGTAASAIDFTVIIAAGGYHEVFNNYTGRIDGIWSADAAGAALVTELT